MSNDWKNAIIVLYILLLVTLEIQLSYLINNNLCFQTELKKVMKSLSNILQPNDVKLI